MAVEQQAFKNVLSRWATGITVITTADGDNRQGFTANSFATVSIDPPLITMNVAKRLESAAVIRQVGKFAINILRVDQIYWGKVFAGFIETDNRFEGIDVTLSNGGCPLLPDTLGWLDCEVYHMLDVGENLLFVGQVMDAGWIEEDADPLLYYHRHWGKFLQEDPRD